MQVTNCKDQSLRKKSLKRTLTHSIAVFLGFSFFYILFFSPVLFSDRLLAQPADGIAYFLPAFYSPRNLWTELVFAGYPIAADPQNMTWYPPSLLLSLIPNSWNAFVVMAYVLASSFGYCYTYTLTSSRLAAIVTGLVYSLSGFMIGYIPMAAMIHAAAWMPLIVCALEKLRHRVERGWFAIGVLAVACCFLGGHPQISVYGIGIGFFYALFLGWSAPIGRWKYYRWASATFILGISLCAIQLLPAIELSRLSVRKEMPYEIFLGGSLPIFQGLQFLFPFLFGHSVARVPFNSHYWGDWDPATTAVYVGLLSLLLAVIGSIAYRKRAIARFWFWAGLITLILTFGGDLLLGRVLYYIPIYNLFKDPARHVVEFAFATSVLAGLGIGSIQQRWVSDHLIRKTITVGLMLMLVSLIGMNMFYSDFQARASLVGINQLNLLPWNNPAVGIPCVIFVLGAITLFTWSRWIHSRWMSLTLLIILLLDLSSFGFWFRDWNIARLAPATEELEESSIVQSYRLSLQNEHQRFLPAQGSVLSWLPNAIAPNLTRLWELPSAGGYSPLILSRFSEMMHMDYNGALHHIPVNASEHQLDLMAVRYLLAPSLDIIQRNGVVWADTDLGLSLATGPCTSSESDSAVTLNLSDISHETTTIGLVTTMGCSSEISDNAEVVQVQVTDAQGKVETHSLLAGRDTSEHAYDCPDVKPNMQHQRAQVFSSKSISRPGAGACQEHDYVSMIQLSRPQQISNLEFNWTNLPAKINIKRISLINGPEGKSLPWIPIELSTKWKKVEQIDSGIIYENQQVLPRVWLVPETIPLKPDDILTAVQTSQLPDDRTYEPEKMALVEDNAAEFKSSALQPTDTAKVLKLADTQVELQTKTSAPAFLVLSDVFYPGWKATIDGKSTQMFQTNYIQRGVKVPPGEHIVRFEFHPLSFKIGVGITAASLFGGSYWLLWKKRISG